MRTDGDTHLKLDTRRSVWGIIGVALRCYRLYPALFVEITLSVVVPYALIVLVINGGGLLGNAHRTPSAALIVLALNLLLVGPLISALHIHALTEIAEHGEPDVTKVLARGLGVLPIVIGAQILAAIGTSVGLLLLIIPGIVLLARWSVVAQVAALERLAWTDALRRSAHLTGGSYLHILGLLLAIGVFDGILQEGGRALVDTAATSLQVLAGIGVDTITLSLSALTTAVLYFELFARRAKDLKPPSHT